MLETFPELIDKYQPELVRRLEADDAPGVAKQLLLMDSDAISVMRRYAEQPNRLAAPFAELQLSRARWAVVVGCLLVGSTRLLLRQIDKPLHAWLLGDDKASHELGRRLVPTSVGLSLGGELDIPSYLSLAGQRQITQRILATKLLHALDDQLLDDGPNPLCIARQSEKAYDLLRAAFTSRWTARHDALVKYWQLKHPGEDLLSFPRPSDGTYSLDAWVTRQAQNALHHRNDFGSQMIRSASEQALDASSGLPSEPDLRESNNRRAQLAEVFATANNASYNRWYLQRGEVSGIASASSPGAGFCPAGRTRVESNGLTGAQAVARLAIAVAIPTLWNQQFQTRRSGDRAFLFTRGIDSGLSAEAP